jgi:hypothetical protein
MFLIVECKISQFFATQTRAESRTFMRMDSYRRAPNAERLMLNAER